MSIASLNNKIHHISEKVKKSYHSHVKYTIPAEPGVGGNGINADIPGCGAPVRPLQ